MTTYVLFGITGDLAAKKILPALSSLHDRNLLPKPFSIIGVSRKELTDTELRTHLEDRVDLSDTFTQKITCVSGAYDSSDTYTLLKEKLAGSTQVLFHLAVPPSAYAGILTELAKNSIAGNHPILIEKPFGTSLETAKALQALVEEHFTEKQIFRIDHYLAKGGMQNLLAQKLRGQAQWNKDTVAKIHVATYETMTVAGRVGFYDDVGALKDVLQNHILEMFATALMERPLSEHADDIQTARAAALTALPSFSPEHTVIRRGQYEGYLIDAEVAASNTETYVRIETELTGPTYAGVKCSFEGGKALAHTVHSITLTYTNGETEIIDVNETPENQETLTNYGRLMFDALNGDQTLFASKDEVMTAWEYVTPILEQFSTLPLVIYPKGADRI